MKSLVFLQGKKEGKLVETMSIYKDTDNLPEARERAVRYLHFRKDFDPILAAILRDPVSIICWKLPVFMGRMEDGSDFKMV